MRKRTHNPDSNPLSTTTRREFVQALGAAALGTGIALVPARSEAESTKAPAPSTALRFVFFPDPHLRDEFRSAEGLAAALQAVERLEPRPAFIWTGGDLCHDLRSLDLEAARARAERFVEIWQRHCTIPTHHILGNHDAAGWGKGAIPPDHPDFAFGLLRRLLGLERSYYAFDHGAWHFVVLDNVHRTSPGKHVGLVDEEQLAWLRSDLKASRERPTMVAMHVPPLTAVEFLTGRATRDVQANEWRIGFDRMSGNPHQLLEALSEGNVKAVLSCHLHQIEQLELRGQRFLCLGSVSAQQWMGPREGTGAKEGFAVMDLERDGRFNWTYQEFGWQPSPEALRAQGG